MSLTAKVLKLDREQMRVTTIYEIIGKFGSRLPQDVINEMRKEAEDSQKEVDKKMENLI